MRRIAPGITRTADTGTPTAMMLGRPTISTRILARPTSVKATSYRNPGQTWSFRDIKSRYGCLEVARRSRRRCKALRQSIPTPCHWRLMTVPRPRCARDSRLRTLFDRQVSLRSLFLGRVALAFLPVQIGRADDLLLGDEQTKLLSQGS